ncbi:Protein AXL-1 b [Aphelenchoides avenae]|nr:Protein AXL-1 b [Aphelenchus avenae]
MNDDERERWARSIESVLVSRTVFDVFHQFLQTAGAPQSAAEAAPSTSAAADVLDLHFMILAFRTHAEQRHPRTAQIALALHRRYVSRRTGTVNIVPEDVRASISSRVHSIRPNHVPTPELFDPCASYVWAFLCEQHSLFVRSQAFCELLRKLEREERLDQDAALDGISPIVSSSSAAAPEPATDRVAPGGGRMLSKSRQRKTRSRPRSVPPGGAQQGTSGKQREATAAATSTQQPGVSHCPRVNCSNLRHDRREDREEFARILTERLNLILAAIQQRERECGGPVYARELFVDATAAITDDYLPAPMHYTDGCAAEACPQPAMAQSYHPAMPLRSQPAKPFTHGVRFEDRNDSLNEVDEEIDRYAAQRRDSVSISPRQQQTATTIPASFDTPQSAYGRGGFAPPPTMSQTTATNSSVGHQMPAYSSSAASYRSLGGYAGSSYYSDTSGFSSSASARQQQSTDHRLMAFRHVDHRKLYEKARILSSQADSDGKPTTLPRTPTGSQASNKRQETSSPQTSKRATDEAGSSLMTVSYTERDGVPFVAKVPPCRMTFRDFRHQFGISSKANKRFLFKSECEDGSAPFQWTIATDDSMVLPLFEGRITAECRNMSDSE